MTDAAPLPAGTLIAGKLRIVRLLGQGGMGAVYEVEHEFTKHRRALKLLHAEMAKHEHIVARFLREASAAGRIGNQHIVETFDAGRLDSGEPYLVMELLDGETLHARLQRLGTLPLEEIADLVGQACDGVQAAHDAGIIHRDLKPENILTIQRADGPLVKLLDFGISRFDPTITGTHAVTREGSALGTPYYMSPEQIEGESDIDSRTDIYALGVILYECATGRRPFEADALPRLSVLIHQGTPPPLSDRRPDLPPALVDVIMRAMARSREDRFKTARELRDALMHFGSSALGATLDGRETAPSRRSVPVRISDRSTTPTPAAEAIASGPAIPNALAPSMAGSALSVAQEKKRSPRGLAFVVVLLVMAGAAVIVSIHRDTSSITPPKAMGLAPPGSTTPVAALAVSAEAPTHPVSAPPEPAASVPPAAASGAVAPTGSGSAAPVKPSGPAPSATPPVPPKPAPNSPVNKRGIVTENPYEK